MVCLDELKDGDDLCHYSLKSLLAGCGETAKDNECVFTLFGETSEHHKLLHCCEKTRAYRVSKRINMSKMLEGFRV